MTIKSRNKSPEKKKLLEANLNQKNVKRAKHNLIKSLPYALQQIADQLGILSDLSLITDSKGNILWCGNPVAELECNKKIFMGKNVFLFINTGIDKNKILK
jgi:hypothetical protein